MFALNNTYYNNINRYLTCQPIRNLVNFFSFLWIQVWNLKLGTIYLWKNKTNNCDFGNNFKSLLRLQRKSTPLRLQHRLGSLFLIVKIRVSRLRFFFNHSILIQIMVQVQVLLSLPEDIGKVENDRVFSFMFANTFTWVFRILLQYRNRIQRTLL